MIPARIDHCPTLMMSSAGRPSRFARRWASQSPTTIEVAMRMPYQRTGNGPNPKIAGIWNAMAPGDANMTTYDTFPDAFRPRNAEASETVEGGGGGRIRTCTSFRTEPFKGSTAAVTSRPRGSDCIAPEKMEAAAGFEPAHNGFAVRSLNHLGTPPCAREKCWSGKRDSNPRPRPWQGRALPLSYSRVPADSDCTTPLRERRTAARPRRPPAARD